MRAGNSVATTAEYPEIAIPLISSQRLADLSLTDKVLVDIRPPNHFQKGHIKDAKNIDLEVIQDRLDQIPRDKTIVLIDHKGKLTLTTGRFLAAQGYDKILRLDGGFNAWAKNGHPVVKAPEAYSLNQDGRAP